MQCMRWWWLVAVIACSSRHAPPDGADAPGSLPPESDASTDAFDACSDSSVRLTVTKDGVPQTGVHVYFGNDGHLDPGVVQMTDASGVACGFVTAGTYEIPIVTAVNPFGPLGPTRDELFSFEMVQPGDHLLLAHVTPPLTTVVVTFPMDPGAFSYHLHTNCGGAVVTSGASVDLTGCGATSDVLVESLTADGTSRGWLFQADVPLASALTLTGSFQPPVIEHLTFETHNVGTSEVGIHARLATSKGVVYDGPSVARPLSYMNYQPTFDIVRPSIPGATSLTDVSFGYTQFDIQHFVDWYPTSTSHNFDLSAGGLVSYASAISFNMATRYLDYSFTGSQVAEDALRATVDLTRNGDRSWRWHMISSYWARSGIVRFPLLPADEHDWNSGTANSAQVVEATLFTVPGGYDAVRPHAFDFDPTRAIEGSSGRLYYETPR
jgi:hypothetical protein